jgi:hypothetical protein
LKDTKHEGFSIRAIRPGKAETTLKSLADCRLDPAFIESDSGSTTVSNFEVIYSIDLAAKFSGRKVFIEALETGLLHFYEEAGQVLKAWVPPAPKIAKQDIVDVSHNEVIEEHL